MFACNGILFNHESPLRGETFVTRKITRAVSKIALGQQQGISLGNLDAKRDWTHAIDAIKAMYLILQQDQADDFVIATGITTTVRDFVRMAFAYIGVTLRFEGEGVDEIARVEKCEGDYKLETGKIVVKADPQYFRPTEVDILIGDPSKAKAKLGWKPQYDLKALVDDMMRSDLKLMQKDVYLEAGGYRVKNYFE